MSTYNINNDVNKPQHCHYTSRGWYCMGRKSIFLYPSHCLGQISSTNILELWNSEDAWVLMQSPFQNSRPSTMS